MALQIINENPIGSKIGTALGEGFSDSLSALTQNKLQNMFEAQKKSKLQKLLSPIIGEEQAALAVEYPQFLQNPELMFRFGGQQNQSPQQNQQGVLPQSLQQGAQQPQQNQLQNILQQLQSPGTAAQLLARTNLGMEQQQPVQNQPIAQQQVQQAMQQQQSSQVPQQNVPQVDIPQQPQGQVIKGALAKRSPEAEERVQNAIETRNEPFNKLRRTQREYAKILGPLVQEVRGYDKANKLREGVTGFAPGFTLDPEEQRANEIFTKIAALKDSSEGSVRSNYQSLLKQATKPALWKDKKTRELAYNELQRIVDDINLEDEVSEDLIIKNNNRQPRNLETLVEKKVDAIKAKRNQLPKSGDEGDILVDERTGFPEWQYAGDSWKWVGGV